MKARINKILIPSIILGFAVMLMNVSMASAQQQAVPTTNNAQKMETQAQTIQKSVTAGENNMQTTPAQSEKTASTMMKNTNKMPMMPNQAAQAANTPAKIEAQSQAMQKSVTAGENNMQTTPAQSEKTASTMMTNTSKMPMMSSHEIKAVQEALNHNGYKLATDGIMGKHTIAALKGFQKKNDLKVTGRPDTETLAKLKIS
jgi:chromosome segregation ATPase